MYNSNIDCLHLITLDMTPETNGKCVGQDEHRSPLFIIPWVNLFTLMILWFMYSM